MRYYICFHLYLLKHFNFIFSFEIDFLTLYMTLNHQTNNLNTLLRQNYILKDVLHMFLIIFIENVTFYVWKLNLCFQDDLKSS